MMIKGWRAVLAIFVAFLPHAAFSQLATGAPSFATFSSAPFDSLNLANLNIHFAVPIFSRSGRSLPFSYALQYDGLVWSPTDNGNGPQWTANGGWTNALQSFTGVLSFTQKSSFAKDWLYTDPAGTPHTFPAMTLYAPSAGTPNSGSVTSSDGSGFRLSASINTSGQVSATIYTPGGSAIVPPQQDARTPGTYTVKDSNGNTITATAATNLLGATFTDTLGTKVLTFTRTWVGWTSSPSQYDTYQYPAPNGSTSTIQVNYSTYNVATKFGVPGVLEYPDFGAFNQVLVSSIVLPDKASYTFTYEPTPGEANTVTGRLASVTLPTGGVISYGYTGGYNGINSDGSTAGITRTLTDGATSSVWTYSHDVAGHTTIVDPANDETDVTFAGLYEVQRQIYQGSAKTGTLMETVVTCWNGTASNNCGVGATVTPPIQSQITKTTLQGLTSRHDIYFNSNGLLSETDDYDFGNALLRKTLVTYASLSGIVNRPFSVQLQDGAGNVVQQTTYGYDETPVTSTSSAQHGDPPQSQRGNVTSIHLLKGSNSSGGLYLNKTFTYYDTGTLKTATDVNGAQTTYNYADTVSTCANAFATSISAPLSLTTSTTWNCDGAVATKTQDANAPAAVYITAWNDSSFWRATSVSDPVGTVAGTSHTSPTVTETAMSFNNGKSLVGEINVVDGFGRGHVNQHRQGPAGQQNAFESIETDYDSNGRVVRTTIPYLATSVGQTNSAAAAATSSYDALDRPVKSTDAGGGTVSYSNTSNDTLITAGPAPNGENPKQIQYEYDAFGQLTSVCEITAGTATAPAVTCGQANPKTGYWTRYQYDAVSHLTAVCQNTTVPVGTDCVQNASAGQQTRTFQYDLLGRLTAEHEPETGTTHHIYDSDPSGLCTSSSGDLVRLEDQAGNITCYSYDSLHRVTAIHYSGPNGNSTPAKYFVYDGATVNGKQMQYSKGRLAEAYTSNDSGSTKITDEGFSYSPRGEVSEFYESTPHSNGYYHLTAGYWPNGTLANLSGIPQVASGQPMAATGSIALSGNLQTTQVQTQVAAQAIANITINGNEHSVVDTSSCEYVGGKPTHCPTTWDKGTITVSVNGFPVTISYAKGSDSGTIASAMLSAFQGAGSPVSAGISGNVLTLKAPAGSAGNGYSVSMTQTYDTADFSGPSFWGSASTSPAFTGGQDNQYQTIYDSGTISVAVNGVSRTVSYGQGSTPSSIVSALVAAVNGPVPAGGTAIPVTATLNGTTLALTANEPGPVGDYPLSVSQTFNTSYFSGPSFGQAPSGLTLTGGGPAIYYGASNGDGLDGEGRITEVTTGDPNSEKALATNVAYNNADASTSNEPLGALMSLAFGSSDSDSYQYDPNTARLTQYKFNVGSNYRLGTLSWNPNGSLGGLSDYDGVGINATFNCNYGNDDLGRLQSVGCSSSNPQVQGWQQSFSYDPFGNINKSGNLSFQPTYDASSNHISLLSGANVSYDANGNMLNDSLHSYKWDAESRVSSIDGIALVYDAQGHVVEQQNGNNSIQIVYAPTGDKVALMNGQALVKAFVPLPAGATAVYNAGGLAYYRHADWLGSSRISSTPNQTLYYSGAYAPFGEAFAEAGTTDRSFTGQNQDTAPGLYDFMYREFSGSQQGRWISPDPAGLAAADVADPQGWNRYAYVTNRPLGAVDDLGLSCVLATGINTNTGTKDNLAAQYGIGDVIYTYPTGGKLVGIAEVAAQELFGPTGNTQRLSDGLNQYNQDPANSNTLFVVSGSGQGLSTASTSGLIDQDAYKSFQYIVYISPGSSLLSVLPGGGKAGKRLKFHSNGPADFFVTLFSRFHGGHGTGLPCKHGDLACQLREIQKRAPQVYNNCGGARSGDQSGGKDSSGPGDGGSIWAASQSGLFSLWVNSILIENVTHNINPDTMIIF